jgi:hypothetical protein
MNQIDPRLLAQAQMLGGQRRTPTKAEMRQAEHQGIMMAILSVAGTSLSSLLEGGHVSDMAESKDFSLEVANEILNKSEQTKEDFGEDTMKRKLRNQLAAQLTYSTLRGAGGLIGGATQLVANAFESATSLVENADKFASKEVEGAEPNSSSILSS